MFVESPGNPEDGYGGVFNLYYSNVYLANSVIELGKAYQGGGIYLFDTVFQLYNCDILSNQASGDGGGLYQSLYSKYPSYDLCVSVYQTLFDDNKAGGFGGAIYSKLHGKEVGNVRVDNRESCFKIINGTFIENGNISVYVNVTSGQHKVLRNQGALSTFCPDTNECTDFKSVLQYLCVAEIPDECRDFKPIENKITNANPLALIKDIPGASVILYIYGWDAFGNRMLNTEFGLKASAIGAQVINPGGTQSTADKNQFIVPLVVSTGSKDQLAQIIVEDIKGVANPINIQLQITDCDPGYHQKQVGDSHLFECNYCPVEKYTMSTSPCRSCPQGFECSGGNIVYVKENWYGKVGVGTCWNEKQNWDDQNYDPDNSYITTTLCPPGYCCSQSKCRFPNRFDYTFEDDLKDHNYLKCNPIVNDTNSTDGVVSVRRRLATDEATNEDGTEEANPVIYLNDSNSKLCAPNRDPSVPMCGACLPGYYETLSSAGNCAKCDEKGMSNEWIVPVGFFVCFGVVYFFFFMGKRERSVPHPAMTYASKTLLFFYQILTFLTFRSSLQVIKPLAELVNFNFDVSEDGTCLFKNVKSRQKLWLNLLTPCIITFDLFLLLGGVCAKHFYLMKTGKKKTFKDGGWKDDELAMQSAFWAIFMIIYVQITSAFIKLSICYPFGDKSYMWYAGDSECYDIGHGFSLGACVFLIFLVPFIIFRAMKWYKRNRPGAYTSIFAPLILSYSERCWYYTPFNVFRRAILIVLPSVPTNELSIRATLSTFAMGSLLCVHCYLMPFKWTANNHLETFVLLCGFFIATLNITDNPPEFFPFLIAVFAILPLVPLIPLFHEFAKAKGKALTNKLNFEFVWEEFEGHIEDETKGRRGAVFEQSPAAPPPAYTKQISPSVVDGDGDGDTGNLHLQASDVIQPQPTGSFLGGVSVSSSDDEHKQEEGLLYERAKTQASRIQLTPLKDAPDTAHKEDTKWSVPWFGGKTLAIHKRPTQTTLTTNTSKESNHSKDDNTIEDTQQGRKSTIDSSDTKEIKEEVNTKFGTEYEFATGTLPNWLKLWFTKEKKTEQEQEEEAKYNDEPEEFDVDEYDIDIDDEKNQNHNVYQASGHGDIQMVDLNNKHKQPMVPKRVISRRHSFDAVNKYDSETLQNLQKEFQLAKKMKRRYELMDEQKENEEKKQDMDDWNDFYITKTMVTPLENGYGSDAKPDEDIIDEFLGVHPMNDEEFNRVESTLNAPVDIEKQRSYMDSGPSGDSEQEEEEEDISIRTDTDYASKGSKQVMDYIDFLLEDNDKQLEKKTDEHKPQMPKTMRPSSLYLSDENENESKNKEKKSGLLPNFLKKKSFKKPETAKYKVIEIRQKAWRKVDDQIHRNKQQNDDDNNENDDENNDVETLNEDSVIPETPTAEMITTLMTNYSDPLQLFADITDSQYVIPTEYTYIDGRFGPVTFDEGFKSMTFCHNDVQSLELRVCDKDYDGKRVLATWCIADMDKQKVYYKARGNSLLQPPNVGWIRLVDETEWHSSDANDIHINIITKELKLFDAPEFVDLKSNKDSCISIQYDYKQLMIADAPHIRQWIEIIAHNQTHQKTDDTFEIIEINNNNDDVKEEEEQDNDINDNDINDNEVYKERKREDTFFKTLMTNIKLAEQGNKLQKQDWIRERYDFNNLGHEQEYKFTIKLSNTITYAESVLSDCIMPKILPDVGSIDKITCDPKSQILRIDPLYPHKSYTNKSMNPMQLFIQIRPWPGNDSFVMNSDSKYSVDAQQKRVEIVHKPIHNDDKFVQFEQLIVSNIKLGIQYSIVMEADNIIGTNGNYDKSNQYIAVKKPPKPNIEYVTTDEKEWSMAIHVTAKGYDHMDCRAWFELELIDPNIYNKQNNAVYGNMNENENDSEEKKENAYDEDSMEIYKEIMDDIMGSGTGSTNVRYLQSPQHKSGNNNYKSTLDERIVDILNTKHKSSPIILTPLFVGQVYIIRIKCVNHQSVTYSDIHEPIVLEIPPPQPIFTRQMAADAAVLLKYECPNYNFYRGFNPKYEIKAAPLHKQAAITTQTQVKIDSLRNGWPYSFKVRASNTFGESDWSNNVRLKPLKKPDQPTSLHLVSGDKCVTVFWFSFDNMEEPSVCGHFVVISDPTTHEKKAKGKHKVEFQALDNNQFYRFKVVAINKNFKVESDWTVPIKPAAKKDKRIYKQEKALVVDKIMKTRRKKLKELEKKQIKERHDRRQENIDRVKKAQKNRKEAQLSLKKESVIKIIKKGNVETKRRKIIKQLASKANDNKKSDK